MQNLLAFAGALEYNKLVPLYGRCAKGGLGKKSFLLCAGRTLIP